MNPCNYGFGDGKAFNEKNGNPNIYSMSRKFLPAFNGIDYSRATIGELSLFSGLFALINGILGALVVYNRKPYFIWSFSVMSLIIGAFLITAGSLCI